MVEETSFIDFFLREKDTIRSGEYDAQGLGTQISVNRGGERPGHEKQSFMNILEVLQDAVNNPELVLEHVSAATVNCGALGNALEVAKAMVGVDPTSPVYEAVRTRYRNALKFEAREHQEGKAEITEGI